MLSRSLSSALISTLLFISPSSALPSRAHCRCSIFTPDASPSYNDSLANPDTLINPNPIPSLDDLCSTLGHELENLRDTNPALYQSYITPEPAPSWPSRGNAAPASVLIRLPARPGTQTPATSQLRSSSLSTTTTTTTTTEDRPRESILCQTEDELFSTYQGNWWTLMVLQAVVGMVVVASVAEGVLLGVRCMSQQHAQDDDGGDARAGLQMRPSLRLGGAERRLLAVATAHVEARSPGEEKKMRVYASPNWKSPRLSWAQKGGFDAYAEDDDEDEFNRPVM